MRPVLLLPLLLVAPALAGCLDAATLAAAPAGGAEGATLPWERRGCRFVVAFVPVDRDALAPHMPPGFVPTGGAPFVGPVEGTPAEATLGVEAFLCERGTGADGAEVAPMAYGSFFASALPPDEMQVDGPDGQYYVKWDTLVPDAARRERMLAAGMPARAGDVAFEALPRGEAATLAMEGVGTFRFTYDAPQPPSTTGNGFPFAEFTPTAGRGVATWRATVANVSVALGAGVLELEPGSLAAQVAGAERVPVRMQFGAWDFVGGSLALPARA